MVDELRFVHALIGERQQIQIEERKGVKNKKKNKKRVVELKGDKILKSESWRGGGDERREGREKIYMEKEGGSGRMCCK